MMLHSDTLSWLRAKHSLLLLLNDACLLEKRQIEILVFGLIRRGLEPMIYHTWGDHVNHYTTDVVQWNIDKEKEQRMFGS
jgi:hypothetical protein